MVIVNCVKLHGFGMFYHHFGWEAWVVGRTMGCALNGVYVPGLPIE